MVHSHRPWRRIAFRVSYDGTGYHGWQKQPRVDPTIQGELERVLSTFLGAYTPVDGASRTDAGVHAEDQLIAFNTQHPISKEGLMKALNRKLPHAISVRDPVDVNEDFMPRFANHGKRYRYHMYTSSARLPLLDRSATWLHYSLDLEQMAEGMTYLIGERDFASFAATNGQHTTTIRHIWMMSLHRSSLPQGGDLISFEVAGGGFMKQMVRNLVGTLIELGRGHWDVSRVIEALEARDRSAAGPTAPARGLCLAEMYWPMPPEVKILKTNL